MKKRRKYFKSPVFFLVLILGLILVVRLINEATTRRGFESQLIVLGEQPMGQVSYMVPIYEIVPANTNQNFYPSQGLNQAGTPIQTFNENDSLENPMQQPLPEEIEAKIPLAENPEKLPAKNSELVNALCKIFPFLWVCLPEQPQQVAPFQAMPKPLVIVPPLGVAPAMPAQQPALQNPIPQPAAPVVPQQRCNIIKKYCDGDLLKWDYYRLNNNPPPEQILCATPKAVGNCDADHTGRRTCKVSTINGVTTAKCADR